ncbi:MAG TPA: pyridoxal 5'-phosphate synthase glutaminase subunit PdxT, partial [Candidatus Altiarchaeales archaeon]|nr:pyridoxal 5'-phosphate synthase glutaminase subunit PdxT [Candidatus Altiarchaeales archaeon]
GGESTTIGKLIWKYKIDDGIRDIAKNGIPIMGTCAGLVLMAREGDEKVMKTGQPLLELMNMKVDRNVFGRQRESFETDLAIPVLGNKPYHAVFIRAPVIGKIWGETRILAEYEGRIVVAQENNLLALSFHPELSNDLRMHEYFIRMIE